MKKSIFIFVMTTLCILTSCEKEDTPIKSSLLSPPKLVLPINNAKRVFLEGLKLKWTPSVSKEKEAVTYRVTIVYTSLTSLEEKFDVGEETSFVFSQKLARRIQQLNDLSILTAGNQVEVLNPVRVFWSVEAIDSKGHVSVSDTYSFTFLETNKN
ncbi:hypothetical protein HN014_16375 [Aquimarina sp. TRL1]|uniref:hypothetical protein n=1 Tax=Aquimarina sp. (strain TRL1) TaxID=2736252 RepID=UPI00158C2371|nr:hypothetical protein [Aquimarina sp. TRL1]QKX06420.1 hypothetical protein HN014_16375 [Aquimarina sp. TRL1]